MTDENQTENIEDNKDNLQENTGNQVEYSPVELEARDAGWVPEDEYKGDKSKWVDAGEFVRRGSLFKKIDSQSRQLKDMARAIQDIQALHSKSREAEYKKALVQVRAEKKAALEDGDADAVIEADERMEMLRDAQREEVVQPVQTSDGTDHPEFMSWVSRNSWYETNKGMKAFADAVGTELRATGMSPTEVLRNVEKQVRTEFPNRFKNPNQGRPNSVEGTGTSSGSGSGKDSYNLSAQERSIMNNLVRLGVMTEKDYVAELKKVNGD